MVEIFSVEFHAVAFANLVDYGDRLYSASRGNL